MFSKNLFFFSIFVPLDTQTAFLTSLAKFLRQNWLNFLWMKSKNYKKKCNFFQEDPRTILWKRLFQL